MKHRLSISTRPAGMALLAATIAAAVLAVAGAAPSSAATPGPLTGTFRITPGADSPSGVTGSYFRMIQPGGTVAGGPFVVNTSSSAADQTYTFLSPGTDGGLTIGGYQPEPSPAFDTGGNSLSNRIMVPTPFFAINFGVNTNSVDPQTGTPVPVPTISTDAAGNLSGDLRAFAASWNNQEFNQGSPKPDGTSPGLTAGPAGTYNSSTLAYTLDWTSLIVGGPFNGFTGRWHLTGTLAGYPRPKSATSARVALVPGYDGCTAPNRTHGPPLAHPSCSPPAQSSGHLTVGTPDANGAAPNSTAFAKYASIVGAAGGPDDSDVEVAVSITDVRSKAGLTDYAGQVQLSSRVRITDRLNGDASSEPGTVQDIDLQVTVPCAATASTTVGATCAATTTFDAIAPGSVPEGKRSIWRLGQVVVNDGGADGVVSTTPNTVFMRQGLFAP